MAQPVNPPERSMRNFGHFIVQPQKYYQPNEELKAFVFVAWVPNTGPSKDYQTCAVATLIRQEHNGNMLVGSEGYEVSSQVNTQRVTEHNIDMRVEAPDLAWDPNRPLVTWGSHVPNHRPAVFVFQRTMHAPSTVPGNAPSTFVRVIVYRDGFAPNSGALARGQSYPMLLERQRTRRCLSSGETYALEYLGVPPERWGRTPTGTLYKVEWSPGRSPRERLWSPDGTTYRIPDVGLTVRNAHHRTPTHPNIKTVLMAFRMGESHANGALITEEDLSPNFFPFFRQSPQGGGPTNEHVYTWKIILGEELVLPGPGEWMVIAWVYHVNREQNFNYWGRQVPQIIPGHFLEGGPKFCAVIDRFVAR
ncbi:hypothetical protein QBC41DRAFT_307661 [Cercophora samala]|uniref:Uncharacterized protein n=1 Tax=Cercophora samala TaxID=330535 RepID=A0AA39YYJ5_9PEZI|nr:hypothetical protein QBC41DRAFT_307661 [Cercophora samala]